MSGTKKSAPFSRQTFHASAGKILDKDNLVNNLQDEINCTSKQTAGVSNVSSKNALDRYNRLKSRTRSRPKNNSEYRADMTPNGLDRSGALGSIDINTPPRDIAFVRGAARNNNVDSHEKKTCNGIREVYKENLNESQSISSTENTLTPSTKRKTAFDMAEKIGFSSSKSKARSLHGNNESRGEGFDDFLNQLKREVASEHTELWNSFQIAAGFDTPETMAPLFLETQLESSKKSKRRVQLKPATKQKLASVHKFVRGRAHKSNIAKEAQIVNDRRLKRERAGSNKNRDDESKRSKRSENGSLSSSSRKERRKREKGRKSKKKVSKMKSNKIDSGASLGKVEKALNLPYIVDFPSDVNDGFKQEEQPMPQNDSSVIAETDENAKRRKLPDYFEMNPASCEPLPTMVATKKMITSRPPRHNSYKSSHNSDLKKPLSWLNSLREKQKRRKKDRIEDDDDDRSVTTVELEKSAQDAVGRNNVISIFGNRVALAKTPKHAVQEIESAEVKKSPWQVHLKPVRQKHSEKKIFPSLPSTIGIPLSNDPPSTGLEVNHSDEYDEIGESEKMVVENKRKKNDSADEKDEVSTPNDSCSLIPDDVIDLLHLPHQHFEIQNEVTVVPITNNSHNRNQVVILGRKLLVVASRFAQDDVENVGKDLANILWQTKRDSIESLNLNGRADGVMLTIDDGTTFPLNFENCSQCVSFIQTYTGLNNNGPTPIPMDLSHNSAGIDQAECTDAGISTISYEETPQKGNQPGEIKTKKNFDLTKQISNVSENKKDVTSLEPPMHTGSEPDKAIVSVSHQFTDDEMDLIVKLRKMMKYDTSEDAVKYKMDLDKVAQKVKDAVFDKDVKVEIPPMTTIPAKSRSLKDNIMKNLESHLKSRVNAGSAESKFEALSDADELIASKFRKMLKVGMPKEVVKHAMKRDQIDDRIAHAVLGENDLTSDLPPENDDERVASRFQKMLQLNISPHVVRSKMKLENVKEEIIEKVFGPQRTFGTGVDEPTVKAPIREEPLSPKKQELVNKYKGMLKMGIPQPAVRHCMIKDEAPSQVTVAVFGEEKTVKTDKKAIDQVLSETEKELVEKYKKMLKMGIPPPAVRQCIIKDKASNPVTVAVFGDDEQKKKEMKPMDRILSDDEKEMVNKYKKMSKIGLPVEVIHHEMKKQNVPQDIIDIVLGKEGGSKAPTANSSPLKRKNGLMPIHWETLSKEKIKNNDSIWSRTAKKPRLSTINIDLVELEQLFKKQPHKAKVNNKSTESTGKGNQMARLLEINRAQNVSISLQAFKQFSLDELVAIIRDIDPDNKIQGERVLFLKGLLPKQEETSLLKKYKGEETRLVDAEKFFLKLLPIQRVPTKIKVMEAMEMFNQNSRETTARFTLLMNTCHDVVHSEKLQHLLEAVLTVGNIMNQGTRSGDAAGIKFSSLLKLSRTKSKDGKTSVLDYIVSWFIGKGERDNLDLSKDIPNCSEASRILITDVEGSFTSLDSSMKICRTEYSKLKSEQLTLEQDFTPGTIRLGNFIKSAGLALESLQISRDKTKVACKELADYVGEDGGERAATEVLLILTEFTTNINLAVKKHDNIKEAEARKEAARKRREEALAKTSDKKMKNDDSSNENHSMRRTQLFKDSTNFRGGKNDGNTPADPRQVLLQSIKKRRSKTVSGNDKTNPQSFPPNSLEQGKRHEFKYPYDEEDCDDSSETSNSSTSTSAFLSARSLGCGAIPEWAIAPTVASKNNSRGLDTESLSAKKRGAGNTSLAASAAIAAAKIALKKNKKDGKKHLSQTSSSKRKGRDAMHGSQDIESAAIAAAQASYGGASVSDTIPFVGVAAAAARMAEKRARKSSTEVDTNRSTMIPTPANSVEMRPDRASTKINAVKNSTDYTEEKVDIQNIDIIKEDVVGIVSQANPFVGVAAAAASMSAKRARKSSTEAETTCAPTPANSVEMRPDRASTKINVAKKSTDYTEEKVDIQNIDDIKEDVVDIVSKANPLSGLAAAAAAMSAKRARKSSTESRSCVPTPANSVEMRPYRASAKINAVKKSTDYTEEKVHDIQNIDDIKEGVVEIVSKANPLSGLAAAAAAMSAKRAHKDKNGNVFSETNFKIDDAKRKETNGETHSSQVEESTNILPHLSGLAAAAAAMAAKTSKRVSNA